MARTGCGGAQSVLSWVHPNQWNAALSFTDFIHLPSAVKGLVVVCRLPYLMHGLYQLARARGRGRPDEIKWAVVKISDTRTSGENLRIR